MPFVSHLIHTCTIETNTPTQSDTGAEKEGWSDESTGVSCRLVDRRSFRPMENVGQQVQFDKLILFPSGTTIDTERRVSNVQDADSNIVDAGPFRVLEVNSRRTKGPSAHHVSAKLERVL